MVKKTVPRGARDCCFFGQLKTEWARRLSLPCLKMRAVVSLLSSFKRVPLSNCLGSRCLTIFTRYIIFSNFTLLKCSFSTSLSWFAGKKYLSYFPSLQCARAYAATSLQLILNACTCNKLLEVIVFHQAKRK